MIAQGFLFQLINVYNWHPGNLWGSKPYRESLKYTFKLYFYVGYLWTSNKWIKIPNLSISLWQICVTSIPKIWKMFIRRLYLLLNMIALEIQWIYSNPRAKTCESILRYIVMRYIITWHIWMIKLTHITYEARRLSTLSVYYYNTFILKAIILFHWLHLNNTKHIKI